MAAMAGGLGVRLAKRGSYDFNAAARPPGADDIRAALAIAGG
jgi:cobalamin biosynthesis protein CobD/CbiB